MNILPKKSWHVRTKKNIERVRRDEAEADRATKLEQNRRLEVEKEVRSRELRARSGLPDIEPKEHFNLFEGYKEKQDLINRDHEEEKRRDNERWQQRVGIINKLVRDEDADRPWYCNDKKFYEIKSNSATRHGRRRSTTNLIASMYDPMTAIRNAEEIVRSNRSQRTMVSWPEPDRGQPKPPINEDSNSSLEIVGEVSAKEKRNISSSMKTKTTKKIHKRKLHKHKSHHRKHKRDR